MVNVIMDDPNLSEHVKCIRELRKLGMPDEDIQQYYNAGVKNVIRTCVNKRIKVNPIGGDLHE